MSVPRLVACHFQTNTNGDRTIWPRLSRVFRHTAGTALAGWSIEIAELEPLPMRSSRATPWDGQNTQKLDHWVDAVIRADDHDRMALLDADTAILRSLDEVWDRDFDLALTKRPRGWPYNGGVVFVRVSPAVRHFFERWREENRRMLGDRPYHARWQKIYGGLNQAALGMLLETGAADGLKIERLPCVEWNCEDTTWTEFGPTTRVLHVKSALRLAIFSGVHPSRELQPLRDLWLDLERQAKAA